MTTPGTATATARRAWDKDDLKRRVRLRDLVAHHGVALRRDGANRWKALCPFHEETDPSFIIFAATDTWKCFGCGRGGDQFRFLWYLRGAGEPLAAAFPALGDELAAFAGQFPVVASGPASLVATPKEGSSIPDRDRFSEEAARILTLAVCCYQRALWDASAARAYLRERAIPWWATRDLRLGWADADTLVSYLANHEEGRLLPVAHDLGLLHRTPRGYRDHLGGRIVIPEIRESRAIWLIGRALDRDAPRRGRRPPKYLALPGPKPVLGLESVARRPEVFLCEGTLDWVTLRAWGYPACCSNGAAALAPAIAAVSGAARVWGVFDDDEAGCTAAERIAAALGDRFRRLALPAGRDPNALAATPDGRAIFATRLAEARRSPPGLPPPSGGRR